MNPNFKDTQFKKGQKPWNYGIKTGLVPKTAFKKGQRPSRKTEFKKGENIGEFNSQWKGLDAGYRAIHHWVELHLGKASKCSKDNSHTSKRYHWANISHTYKRDLNDYMELCVPCHKKYDLEYRKEKNGKL
jgi:hypothetical protein